MNLTKVSQNLTLSLFLEGRGTVSCENNLSPFESPSPYHGEGEDRRCICIGGGVEKNQHPI